MTEFQHRWGESKLKKKTLKNIFTLTIKLMKIDSDFLHASLLIVFLHVNIHLGSQPLQPRNIMAKPRVVILIQVGVLT